MRPQKCQVLRTRGPTGLDEASLSSGRASCRDRPAAGLLFGVDERPDRSVRVADDVGHAIDDLDHGQPLWLSILVELPGELVSDLEWGEQPSHSVLRAVDVSRVVSMALSPRSNRRRLTA